jgi:hypothetical protein
MRWTVQITRVKTDDRKKILSFYVFILHSLIYYTLDEYLSLPVLLELWIYATGSHACSKFLHNACNKLPDVRYRTHDKSKR